MRNQDAWSLPWPAQVRRCVSDVVGPVRATEALAGLSGRDVRRVDGDRGSVVVKGPAAVRELEFYTEVAPALEGLPIPRLHGGFHDGTSGWLVLEHVPRPLPRSEWSGNPAMYDVLAQLHVTASAAFERLSSPFRPRWADDMTDRVRAAHRVDLTTWQAEAQGWLAGDVPISGDANPANWAVRDDDTLVLLDWERAGRGNEAVDVATTLPGLPSRAEAEAVAAAYVAARERRGAPTEADGMVRGLQLAKLWTAVELLQEDRDHHPGLRQTQEWLVAELPGWLETWS